MKTITLHNKSTNQIEEFQPDDENVIEIPTETYETSGHILVADLSIQGTLLNLPQV
jgi:hypothetical protein